MELCRCKDPYHLIDFHLNTDVSELDFSNQSNIDNNIVTHLAKSENASAIKFLNLMSTNVGYSGIIELLKSDSFGSLVSDYPKYEPHLGMPISTIKIEIGQTRLSEQYKRGLFTYPLPLIRDFEITYGHRCLGLSQPLKKKGYKQIQLFDHGNELKAIKKGSKHPMESTGESSQSPSFN